MIWEIILRNDTIFNLLATSIVMIIAASIMWIGIFRKNAKRTQEAKEAEARLHNTIDIYVDSSENIVLKDDEIFRELDSYLQFFVYRYDLGDPGLTLLCKELMWHKIKFWIPILTDLADKIDSCYSTCHGANMARCNVMQRTFAEAYSRGMRYVSFMDEFEIASIDGVCYTESDKNIMRELMVDFARDVHHSKEVVVDEWISSIWGSNSYINCLTRAKDCFRIYSIAFKLAKIDSETLGTVLHDKYSGRTFLGTNIGNIN